MACCVPRTSHRGRLVKVWWQTESTSCDGGITRRWLPLLDVPGLNGSSGKDHQPYEAHKTARRAAHGRVRGSDRLLPDRRPHGLLEPRCSVFYPRDDSIPKSPEGGNSEEVSCIKSPGLPQAIHVMWAHCNSHAPPHLWVVVIVKEWHLRWVCRAWSKVH
jgi:hypothetical protein